MSENKKPWTLIAGGAEGQLEKQLFEIEATLNWLVLAILELNPGLSPPKRRGFDDKQRSVNPLLGEPF